jgi:hypothetical protein
MKLEKLVAEEERRYSTTRAIFLPESVTTAVTIFLKKTRKLISLIMA